MKLTNIRFDFLYATLSAILFGASTPFSKYFLNKEQIAPLILSGLFYFSSGMGLLILFLSRIFKEKRLPSSELKYLALAILFGGVLGPAFLLYGLKTLSSSSASLLLNFEGVFTASLAWFVFKEHFDRRIALGMFFIVLGGVILSLPSFQITGIPFKGTLLVLLACLCWGIDNNVTRKISLSDPIQIACFKSLMAGSFSLLLAFISKEDFSLILNTKLLLEISLVGFCSYGLSLVLFVYSLRKIGTSRTGAYFSMAPFIGLALSFLFFKEELNTSLVLATSFMLIGIWLHLSERHSHFHWHKKITHSHSHLHDEHHQHCHTKDAPPCSPQKTHEHLHEHEEIFHEHEHYPDPHHRHSHK